MNISFPTCAAVLAAATFLCAALPTAAQSTTHTYSGNGATGFSGYLGKGSLTIKRSANGDITFSLFPKGSSLGTGKEANGVALYIDSTPGGFASTAEFSDNGDPGHEIISGANLGTNTKFNTVTAASRSLVTFAPGFKADYALSFEGTYVGLFKLAAGKDNSMAYIMGAGQKSAPYTITVPGSKIGVGPDGTFKFVATLISDVNAYRSNETIGATVQGNEGKVPGFSGPVTFTGFETFPATR